MRRPYALQDDAKRSYFLAAIHEMTVRQAAVNKKYQSILKLRFPSALTTKTLEDMPYLPVDLFKFSDLALDSSFSGTVVSSSGTSGSKSSSVRLDRETSLRQKLGLFDILFNHFGQIRPPVIVCEKPAKRFAPVSASAAAASGFGSFGRSAFYLTAEMTARDKGELTKWLEGFRGEPGIVFGFTATVYELLRTGFLRQTLRRDVCDWTLLHGGGWKRLSNLDVSKEAFDRLVFAETGIESIKNYYGLAEQLGSIFIECEEKQMHVSDFSYVIVRGPDGTPIAFGEAGLLQVFSVLSSSYPGHSLLTGDVGSLVSIDNCPCGRAGQVCYIKGRLDDLDLRGCGEFSH